MNWKQSSIAAATVLSLAGAAAFAQSTSQPASGTPDMMGGYSAGYGPRIAPAFHAGYGMGPGMMGGYGGYGMGPGMMGGYGGYGMGPGMMGGYGPYAMGRLNLSDDQRKQLNKIEGDLRKKNWDLMDKMHDEMSKLWASDTRDRSTILAANKRMSELRQQMLENGLDAQDKAESLLTAQQKEQLKQLVR